MWHITVIEVSHIGSHTNISDECSADNTISKYFKHLDTVIFYCSPHPSCPPHGVQVIVPDVIMHCTPFVQNHQSPQSQACE